MKVILSGILALGLITASFAFAAEGAGSTGGGQTKNGQLRDLVDRVRILEIKSGKQLIKELPTYQYAVEILGNVHAVLGKALEAEITKANFYFLDASLNEKVVTGQDGIAKSSDQWEQAGIRISKEDKTEVYVSMPEYAQMDEYHRSFFVLHEMLHGLIKGESAVKYLKLRNFVAYVASLYGEDRLPTQEEFQEVLATHDVEVASLRSGFINALEANNRSLARKILTQLNLKENVSELVIYASIYDNEEVLAILLKESRVDATRIEWHHFGLTPLMLAAKNGSARAAKVLIEAGVDVNYYPNRERGVDRISSYGIYSPLELTIPGWYNKDTSMAKRLEVARVIIASGKLNTSNRETVEYAEKRLKKSSDPSEQELLKIIENAYSEPKSNFKWPWQ